MQKFKAPRRFHSQLSILLITFDSRTTAAPVNYQINKLIVTII